MKIAVFINCNRLLVAKEDNGFRLVFQIHPYTTILGLDIDE